jgi:hypothetical protein
VNINNTTEYCKEISFLQIPKSSEYIFRNINTKKNQEYKIKLCTEKPIFENELRAEYEKVKAKMYAKSEASKNPNDKIISESIKPGVLASNLNTPINVPMASNFSVVKRENIINLDGKEKMEELCEKIYNKAEQENMINEIIDEVIHNNGSSEKILFYYESNDQKITNKKEFELYLKNRSICKNIDDYYIKKYGFNYSEIIDALNKYIKDYNTWIF